MAINYQRMVKIAQKLIDENGRDVVLTLNDRTPVDGTKPWRDSGTNSTQITVRAVVFQSPIEETAVDGQKLAYSRELIHDPVRRGDMLAIVAAKDVVSIDMNTVDTLLDGTDLWHVITVDNIQPGPVLVAVQLKLRK